MRMLGRRKGPTAVRRNSQPEIVDQNEEEAREEEGSYSSQEQQATRECRSK